MEKFLSQWAYISTIGTFILYVSLTLNDRWSTIIKWKESSMFSKIILLILILGILLAAYTLFWNKPKFNTILTKQYAGQIFRNQTVILDNASYIDCTFTDVTFRWSGAPFMFLRANIQGYRNIEVLDNHIANAIDLLKALGFLETEFSTSWQRRNISQ